MDSEINDNVAKLFVAKDFDMPLTTREYLQSRSIEENSRIKTRIKEAIIVSVMYVILIIGLFSTLGYSRHIQLDFITLSAERDTRNIQAEKNLTQVCNFLHILVKSHQATLDTMINDPIFKQNTENEFTKRLKTIKQVQINIDNEIQPTCITFNANTTK